MTGCLESSRGLSRPPPAAPGAADRDPAPAIDQLRQARRPAVTSGSLALGADRAGMRNELLGDLALGGVPVGAHCLRATLSRQRLVACEKLLDLQRVIGERLGRGVDCGQAAA